MYDTDIKINPQRQRTAYAHVLFSFMQFWGYMEIPWGSVVIKWG